MILPKISPLHFTEAAHRAFTHVLKETRADVAEEQLAHWAMEWCNKLLLGEKKNLIFPLSAALIVLPKCM